MEMKEDALKAVLQETCPPLLKSRRFMAFVTSQQEPPLSLASRPSSLITPKHPPPTTPHLELIASPEMKEAPLRPNTASHPEHAEKPPKLWGGSCDISCTLM